MENETTSSYQGLQFYHNQVNIGLYNDVIAFVMDTTAADTMQVHEKLTSKHLWFREYYNYDIQERYGFRYFGELLERFEDKVGSDIRDMRAIALAMGDTKDLFTDDMFVGDQKKNFIKKIIRTSAGDIYLKSAMYLLNKDETSGAGQLEALTKATYSKTEELIFVMSLYDDFEQAFLNFKPRLIHLLGRTRTIPTAGSIDIYCWLIKQLYRCPKIKQIRTKDMALIRALMELPVSFVKAGGRSHNVLLEAGYTAEEIIYLNSSIVRHKPISNSINIDSIVAEKIAIEMCKVYINSENTHSPDAYEHLEWVLKKYNNFNFKISGYQGIYQAIKDDIKIDNPQTFLWLFKTIQPKEVFRFDILDEKWDILSCELETDVYCKLFDKQLEVNSELTGPQIAERIEKYNALTGLSYLTEFEKKYKYDRERVFDLLVNKGIINMKTLFSSCPDIDAIENNRVDEFRPSILIYIRSYVRGIHSREAFDFFKYFFGKYNFDDMHRLFSESNGWGGNRNKDYFFIDQFYKGPPVHYGDDKKTRFEFKRSFLSDDEHRELFGWIDDYMFQYKADKYVEFAVLMLIDSFVKTLFPLAELRQIYDVLRDNVVQDKKIEIFERYSQELKSTFLSEAELQAERDAEKELAKEHKRQAREQEIKTLRDELAALYDGTFKSLLKYLDRHKFSFTKKDDAMFIASEYLDTALSKKNYVLDKTEFAQFLIFSGKLLKQGNISFDTVKRYASLVKEGAAHDENNTTAESDIDD